MPFSCDTLKMRDICNNERMMASKVSPIRKYPHLQLDVDRMNQDSKLLGLLSEKTLTIKKLRARWLIMLYSKYFHPIRWMNVLTRGAVALRYFPSKGFRNVEMIESHKATHFGQKNFLDKNFDGRFQADVIGDLWLWKSTTQQYQWYTSQIRPIKILVQQINRLFYLRNT